MVLYGHDSEVFIILQRICRALFLPFCVAEAELDGFFFVALVELSIFVAVAVAVAVVVAELSIFVVVVELSILVAVAVVIV
jgi:hypothetical protein